ncbi:unnamed protein product [Cladocopium goreaui]|uniref:Uncharacterized protein n=1 Tax=Cladocopium goreaui TaxID=2562237 RepID=A0A9P1BK64_9DINO|nr:unnamed protein product [Cladocopium goreaui]
MQSALHLVQRRRGRRVWRDDGFARLVSSDVEETFFRSETQPVLHAPLDPKLAHAHLEIAAFAKNVSMLDSLAEDLVKALDDLETAAHQVRLSQRGQSLLQICAHFLTGRPMGSSVLEQPLLRPAPTPATTPKTQNVLELRRKFQGLLNDSLGYAQQHPNEEGVALFNQRITMALTIISDAAEANKVIAAVKEIRRLFPFEVDPLEDMPFLAVYMCSLRIRWSYFFLPLGKIVKELEEWNA